MRSVLGSLSGALPLAFLHWEGCAFCPELSTDWNQSLLFSQNTLERSLRPFTSSCAGVVAGSLPGCRAESCAAFRCLSFPSPCRKGAMSSSTGVSHHSAFSRPACLFRSLTCPPSTLTANCWQARSLPEVQPWYLHAPRPLPRGVPRPLGGKQSGTSLPQPEPHLLGYPTQPQPTPNSSRHLLKVWQPASSPPLSLSSHLACLCPSPGP